MSLAWKRLFTPPLEEGGCGTFPPKNVTHRRDPKKDRPWAEPRHLSHKAWISATRFELGVGTRKKDRTGWGKVTKELYFTYLGRRPYWRDLHQKLCSRWCPRRNHVCQVSKWNFQGVKFSIFLRADTTVSFTFAHKRPSPLFYAHPTKNPLFICRTHKPC